jgi:cellulose synthase/poly-beta-1,6-N-acetylglucosamine synthase-like glycosyltransferase
VGETMVLDLYFIILTMMFSLGFLLAWGYIGYPNFLRFITRNTPKSWYWDKEQINIDYLPTVSLIIPTYNEEKAIENKIKNVVELEYPEGKIEFLIVDSNSIDATRDIIKKFPQIQLITENQARGKLSAINHAMKFAKNDIIVINDANTIVEKGALLQLCKPFVDQSIGCVGARYNATGDSTTDLISYERDYREREHELWKLETVFDSCFVCGELFAFRKNLIQELNTHTLGDDLDASIQVRTKGYKVVFQPLAVVHEKIPQNLNDFKLQKMRRTIVAIRCLNYLKSVNWRYKFIFFSHKFIPIISPFLAVLFLLFSFYVNLYLGLSLIGISVSLLLASKKVRYITYMMYICLLAWINNFTIGERWLRVKSTR